MDLDIGRSTGAMEFRNHVATSPKLNAGERGDLLIEALPPHLALKCCFYLPATARKHRGIGDVLNLFARIPRFKHDRNRIDEVRGQGLVVPERDEPRDIEIEIPKSTDRK